MALPERRPPPVRDDADVLDGSRVERPWCAAWCQAWSREPAGQSASPRWPVTISMTGLPSTCPPGSPPPKPAPAESADSFPKPAVPRIGGWPCRAINLVPFLVAAVAMFAATRRMPDLAEDTYIIARYATHVAEGHGYVWNVGELPGDGVTELLHMLLAAGLIRLGLDPRTALVGIAAMATICVTVLVSRRVPGSAQPPSPGGWLMAVVAPYYTSLPLLSAMGYGTATYCLLLAVGGAVAGRLVDRFRWRDAVLLGCVMFLATAARPEGGLIGGAMIAALLFTARRPWTTSAVHASCFVSLTAAYFWVRLRYFGDVLPNTYYVKRGNDWLNIDTISDLGDYWSATLAPWVLLILLSMGFAGRGVRRVLAILLCSFILLHYVLLARFEFVMNWYDRFQQPVLVMTLFAAGIALDVLLDRAVRWGQLSGAARRAWIGCAVAALTAYPLAWIVRQAVTRDPDVQNKTVREDREIAERLRDYSDRGYTMLVSEAGLMPYVSRWRHIDPYGLTDAAIARDGLSLARLESEAPELVMYHAPVYMPGVPRKKNWFPRWLSMVRLLRDFVEHADYDFVGVVPRNGSAESGEHYYVKRSCPDAAALRAIIAPHVLRGASIDPPQRQNHYQGNDVSGKP